MSLGDSAYVFDRYLRELCAFLSVVNVDQRNGRTSGARGHGKSHQTERQLAGFAASGISNRADRAKCPRAAFVLPFRSIM